MKSSLHLSDPRAPIRLALLWAALMLLITVWMQSCLQLDDIPIDQIYIPPHQDTIVPQDTTGLPIVIDTPECTPVLVTEPPFLTMYLGLQEPQTEVVFQAGAYSTTLYLDQPGKKDSIISVLKHFHPEYNYTVYLTNWFQFAVFVDGTNDKTLFQLKVHTRSDGLNQWPTFSIQAFFFGGILTYAEYRDVIKMYPSCRSFNFRLLDATPSQVDTLSLAILKCHLGRELAEFRWGNVNDTIPPLFVAAGWHTVRTNLTDPWDIARGYHSLPEGTVYDLRDRCVDDEEILDILNQGYSVITRA